MTGGGGGMGGEAQIHLHHRLLEGGGDDDKMKSQAFLAGAGIPFDDGKGHKFVFDGFQMIVTHDRRSLTLLSVFLLN